MTKSPSKPGPCHLSSAAGDRKVKQKGRGTKGEENVCTGSQTPVWEPALGETLFRNAVAKPKRSFGEGRSQTGVWERDALFFLTSSRVSPRPAFGARHRPSRTPWP